MRLQGDAPGHVPDRKLSLTNRFLPLTPNLCAVAPRPHRYAKRCGQGLGVRFAGFRSPHAWNSSGIT